MPLHIISTSDNGCETLYDAQTPPELSEREEFLKRTVNNRVVKPFRPECLARNVNKKNIILWSERGDALAVYTRIVIGYDENSRICKNKISIEKELRKISEIKTKFQISNGGYRIPEASYAVGMLRQSCRLDNWRFYIRQARLHGLDDGEFLSRHSL